MTTASSSPIQRAVTAAFGVSQSIIGAAGDIAGGTMGSTMGGEGVADRVGEMTSGRIEQLVRTPIGELHLNAVGGATLHARRTGASTQALAPSRSDFASQDALTPTDTPLPSASCGAGRLRRPLSSAASRVYFRRGLL